MHWAANSSTSFMPDQQFVDFLSCLNPTRISFSSAIYLNGRSWRAKKEVKLCHPFPPTVTLIYWTEKLFSFLQGIADHSMQENSSKNSVFTVDMPFIKSKRFPRSSNAPSTKSAHSVTDISSMKTVHQRQRSPDSPTTPLY